MNRLRLFVLGVFACCAVVSNASAQQQSNPLVPILAQAQRDNWLVQIEDANGHEVQGRVVEQTTSVVRVGRSKVDVNGVHQLSRGSREGGGSMPVGIAGGALLGGLGMTVEYAFCERSDCGSQVALATVSSAAIGFFIGMIAGEALNPAHIKWKQVWP